MYRCSNCGATMSQPLDRCPSCRVLLSGVKCDACGYVGGKSEFISNNHRCPKCNSTVYVSGGYATHSSTPVTISASNKSPLVAALLSLFLIGGGGQIYLGQWKKGLVLILATFFLVIPGILGIGDAYGTAQKLSRGISVEEWKFNINWKVVILVTIIYIILVIALYNFTS